MNGVIKTFRALSGSQHIYFTSDDVPPVGINNKTIIKESITDSSAVAAAPPTTDSDILWAWNGTDTTQFESAPAVLQNFSSTALSIETTSSAPLGSYLVVSGNGSSGRAIWLANYSLPSTSYVIEMGIHSSGIQGSPPTAGGYYGGLCFMASGSNANHRSLALMKANSSYSIVALFNNDAVATIDSSNNLGGTNPAKIEIYVTAGKVIGSKPTFNIKAEGYGHNIAGSDSLDHDSFWWTDSDWDSVWKNIPEDKMRRFGVAVATAGGWTNPFIRFSYIVVRKHSLEIS